MVRKEVSPRKEIDARSGSKEFDNGKERATGPINER